MKIKQKSIFQIIRKRIYIILSLLLLSVLFLTAIILQISKGEKRESLLMDMSGRQQMLVQSLSKDANLKYAILQALERGPLAESRENLQRQLTSLDASMQSAKEEYAAADEVLRSGRLRWKDAAADIRPSLREVSGFFAEAAPVWDSIRQSADVMIEADEAGPSEAEAILNMNRQDDRLTEIGGRISDTLIHSQKRIAGFHMLAALLLFLASLGLLLISLFRMHMYIAAPLNELYRGIHDLGVGKNDEEAPVFPERELNGAMEEIRVGFRKLNRLVALIENMNQDVSFEGILHYIYQSFSEFIPYSHIGVALLKEGGLLEASFGVSRPPVAELPKKLLGIRVHLGDTSLQDVVFNGRPRVINDLAAYTKQRGSQNNGYNRILLEAGIQASIALPLKTNDRPVGILFFSSERKNIYEEQHIEFLQTLSNSIALSLYKNIFIDELLFSTILALAKMAEARDEETGEHLERMKQYTVRLAEWLQEEPEYGESVSIGFLKDLERFSPMHDIGKVGIRDGILLKPGKLTEEEFREMKQHTVYGADVLRTAEKNINKQNRSMFRVGIEIAENHHEKWDGTGYPHGKAGEEIPLSARIVTVADVFDALTSRRPYKEEFPFEDSFAMITGESGTRFDPGIIRALVRHKEELRLLWQSFYK